MAKIKPLDIHQLADQIFKIGIEITAYEEGLKPMKEKQDHLREAMLRAMTDLRLPTFRSEDVPVTFSKAYRKGYEIKDASKAKKWAIEHDCVKIDTASLGKHLEGAGALPDGIEYKETAYLSVRKSD